MSLPLKGNEESVLGKIISEVRELSSDLKRVNDDSVEIYDQLSRCLVGTVPEAYKENKKEDGPESLQCLIQECSRKVAEIRATNKSIFRIINISEL